MDCRPIPIGASNGRRRNRQCETSASMKTLCTSRPSARLPSHDFRRVNFSSSIGSLEGYAFLLARDAIFESPPATAGRRDLKLEPAVIVQAHGFALWFRILDLSGGQSHWGNSPEIGDRMAVAPKVAPTAGQL